MFDSSDVAVQAPTEAAHGSSVSRNGFSRDIDWRSRSRYCGRRIQNDPGVAPATGSVDISTLKDSLADSSVFLLPRTSCVNPKEKAGDLLHIPHVKALYCFPLLVCWHGNCLRKESRRGTRYQIVSVIDRTINFQLRRVTMMSDHEKERSMMDHPSRRSFLGMSSVALATAALAGLSANAQNKESTQKAEHDHSSSDPAQENKPLLTENPNSNTPSTDRSWRYGATSGIPSI